MFSVTSVEQFNEIANLLLNKYLLIINGYEYRISEIEFYYYSESHRDEYTHKDDNQKKNGEWYFHRQNGKSYKNGTFKGLDISAGSDNSYGGILIRSIEISDNLIEGPCNVVNKILELTNSPDINSLVSKISVNVLDQGLLFLKDTPIAERRIMKSMRVGLSLKKIKSFEFICKEYRYLTSMNIKKNKCTIVLSSNDYKIWGKTNIDKWLQHYNEGISKTEEYFLANPSLSTVQIQCELLGYVHAKLYSKKIDKGIKILEDSEVFIDTTLHKKIMKSTKLPKIILLSATPMEKPVIEINELINILKSNN